MSTATKKVSCRVCGIEDWNDCGCYYLHGGLGGLGDMNAKVFACPDCGWVTECYSDCPIKEKPVEDEHKPTFNALYIAGMLGLRK